MKLKLALDRQRASAVDVIVEIDATATVSDLVRELVESDPLNRGVVVDPEGVTLAVAPPGGSSFAPLEPEQQLGEAPVGSGYQARVVERTRLDEVAASSAIKARLTVISGPDSGREFVLNAGLNVLGREPVNDVVLTDPLVSRHHARIEVGRSIEIIDLDSANGVEIDAGAVARAVVVPGQVITLGDTKVVINVSESSSERPLGPADGEVVGGSKAFNRSPRVEARYPSVQLPRPEVPSEIDKPPFPWLMMIAPVVMGAAVYAFTQSPLSLLFVAMSPMMLTSNYYMTRMRAKHRLDAQIARFEEQLSAMEAYFVAEAPKERQVRNDEMPSTLRIVGAATALEPLLWTRRPEHWGFLHLRLGTGRAPSRTTVAAAADSANGLPDLDRDLTALVERFRNVDGVPIVESLSHAGAIGVAGAAVAAEGVTQALLSQIACLHSPAEVTIAAIGGPSTAGAFEWLKWVPHTSAPQSPITTTHLANGPSTANALLSEIEQLVDARLAVRHSDHRGPMAGELVATAEGGEVGTAEPQPVVDHLPAVVLLIGADAPVSRSRVVQLAERSPDAAIFTVWLAAHPTDLPAVCRTFVDVSGPGDSVGFVRHGLEVRPIDVERIDRDIASELARHLSCVTDSGAASADQTDLPRSISMLSLLGSYDVTDPDAIVDRWRQNLSIHDVTVPRIQRRAGTLRALVGKRGADSLHLDLRAHGPHALVGGTTGAGKSEFLQSWVLGMAAEYSPDRVTFLFVDYKGGAAFAECVKLPHCVGLVTDLSPHLVRRALTSLKAELRRREDVLNQKKVKDILDLEKRNDPDCPPALVLVIDEFAALASEVPDFVDGVVDIAQRGRSLGINLIMATQRPAGVIKDNLRANTNLRIALRMADETDSSDVVGTTEAASFDPAIPGRAVAKVGPGRLIPFQSAYSGGWTTSGPPTPSVIVRELTFGSTDAWEKPQPSEQPADPGPTDLARTVNAISFAAEVASIGEPRRPWLNELGRLYDLSALEPQSDSELILGQIDKPEKQEQSKATFLPDSDGNLAIYGTSGSGKSVLLRTLAAGAGISAGGGPVHVYGLDFAAGGLRMLEVLPHVGSIISGDDSERVVRLLRYLRLIAEERARTFPALNATNIVEYRSNAGRPDEPRILLLIDGFPAFRAEYETAGPRSVAYTMLQELISQGRQLGIHVAFTADRPAGVPGAIASSVPRRVVLRMAEDAMYLVLDVPNDILSSTSPPGRAIIDDLEAQIAVLGGSTNAADQYQALNEWAERIRERRPVAAPPIEAMPTSYPITDLPSDLDGLPILGIAETDLDPISFPDEGLFLLGGGPSSGRSNGLLALVSGLRRAQPQRRLFYMGHRRSRLPDLDGWAAAATSPEEVAELAKQLTDELVNETAPFTVVIESLSDFQSTPADVAIVTLTKALRRSNHGLIAESETTTWNSSFPLFAEIKAARRGLLLQPDGIEGETILRTTFPRASRSEFPPGRGLYAAGGRVIRVQLPLIAGPSLDSA